MYGCACGARMDRPRQIPLSGQRTLTLVSKTKCCMPIWVRVKMKCITTDQDIIFKYRGHGFFRQISLRK